MFIDNLTALTNHDIVRIVKELKIKDFRGVFMRDTLPSKVNTIECGILNLDVSNFYIKFQTNNEKAHFACKFGRS
jgi:hypothetical protein